MTLAPDHSRRRVLVIEDDPTVLDLISLRLDLAGHQSFTARDGIEGLARLAEVRPEAVVLDINMPRLGGFGVLKAIRKTGVLARTPTLVLTARNRPDDVKEAIALGARDFLAKPFRDDQFLARIARLLRRTQPPSGLNVVAS